MVAPSLVTVTSPTSSTSIWRAMRERTSQRGGERARSGHARLGSAAGGAAQERSRSAAACPRHGQGRDAEGQRGVLTSLPARRRALPQRRRALSRPTGPRLLFTMLAMATQAFTARRGPTRRRLGSDWVDGRRLRVARGPHARAHRSASAHPRPSGACRQAAATAIRPER